MQAQAAVFAHFDLPLEQVEQTGKAHGDWMNEVMAALPDDEIVLFVDIDCIPTRKAAVTEAFLAAEKGVLYGVAQVANHKDRDHIYVSPVFMCLSKRVWRQMGSPSFRETDISDAGQHVTRVAQEQGVPVQMSMPTGCLKQVWNLADVGSYGIGTFYQSGLFHLFQARKRRNIRWFLEVASQLQAGERLDPMRLHKRYRRWFGLF
ncbi:MAG: hypothetical protein Q8J78_05865 [Moraxellaceae bacterium]|nr:hypothetical protein [Moraxellaceae bacterium]